MTGWGQEGPLALAAGHDINYIALSGALHAIGPRGASRFRPSTWSGTSVAAACCWLSAWWRACSRRRAPGKGQVVDAAMTDGSALLMAAIFGMNAMGMWSNERGSNLLDSGSHFYDTYTCADGKCVAIGSIEPQFYKLLLEKAGIEDADFAAQMERDKLARAEREGDRCLRLEDPGRGVAS